LNKNFLALVAITMLGSGCASIVSGQNQSVSVETRGKQGQAVSGANCKLSNDKGTWFVTSPGSVSVRRSYDDLLVNCEKETQDAGLASVKSSTKAMAFGNIIFGGLIGAGVDVASGAAYDYPTLITIVMGEKLTIDAPPVDKDKKTKSETTAGTVSTVAAKEQPATVNP
jgi:hypothetical protein